MRRFGTVAAVLGLVLGACSTPGAGPEQLEISVVAEGLIAPIGLAETPDGQILVAEDGTGENDTSGGISIIEDGVPRRLVSGFPSGRDSGDLSGSAMVGVGPSGLVYIGNFGAGHLWTIPIGELMDVESPLAPEELDKAMQPLNSVRLTNPFDITFDLAGRPVVADASGNGVAIETDDGATRFFHRFGELDDPASPMKIDPVPTGIERVDGEYYVTLTGGCPYPDAAGRLVAIDENRSERVVADGLYMPIDVARGPDGTVWVLEFADFEDDASCFTGEGYQANTGRLSRLTDRGLEVVVEGLDRPGAVLPATNGIIYITEVYSGRLISISVPLAEDAEAVQPAHLVDVADQVGLDFVHGAFSRGMSDDPVAAMGAGLCWLDFDADGWMDLYMVNSYSLDEREAWESSDGLPRSQLYKNVGGRFERVDLGSSLEVRGNGCIAADLNGDGWTDIYVTADGPNQLLLNRRGARFEESAVEAGIDTPGWSTVAVAGDVNRDGLMDLFVGGYIDLAVKIPNPTGHFPQDYPGVPDYFYLGRGTGAGGVPQFEEVTAEVGLTRSDRALGAVLSDLDLDGDLDLYVANDGDPNRLYVTEGDGEDGIRFLDATETSDTGDSGSGMGVASGDYDSDGLPDLLVTNWSAELHALYRSVGPVDGAPAFAYSTYRIGLAGLGNNQTGWGTAWLDVDHDTDLDLVVVNGHIPVVDLEADAESMRLYLNQTAQGSAGQFTDGTERLGLDRVGSRLARGSAVADFDNDGDLDVAVNEIGGPATLLRNDAASGNWIEIVTAGSEPGTAASVTLPDGARLRRELHAGSSYLASEDPRLHFGLGAAESVDLTVRWPDGVEVDLQDVAVNQLLVVERP